MTGSSTGGLPINHNGVKYKLRWVGRNKIHLPHSLNRLVPPQSHSHSPPKWIEHLVLTTCFFGIQLVWSCEMALAAPFLLSLGVSKSSMSLVFVAGPLSGLIVQPVVGVVSDRSMSRWGRRRPFIVGGVIVSCISVLLLAWAKEVASWFANEGGIAHQRIAIVLAILSVYLIDFSVNVVQAMDRSLLVDVVSPSDQPSANAWAGRIAGFGALFSYGAGTRDLVSWTGGFVGDTQLKVIACITIFFVIVTHTITVVCVEERVLISREEIEESGGRGGGSEDSENGLVRGGEEEGGVSGREGGEGSNRRTLLSKQGKVGGMLTTMKETVTDVWRTIKTLPRPIRQVFDVQFSSWIGYFPVLFFSTTWIAEIYVKHLPPSSTSTTTMTFITSYPDLASAPTSIRDDATKAGSKAMFYHSIVSFITSIVLPPLISSSNPTASHHSITSIPSTPIGTRPSSPSSSSRPRSPYLPNRQPYSSPSSRLSSFFQRITSKIFPSHRHLQHRNHLSLPLLWTISTGLFSTLLLSTYFVESVKSATLVISLCGFCWAVTNWVPFAILGELILTCPPTITTTTTTNSTSTSSYDPLLDRSASSPPPLPIGTSRHRQSSLSERLRPPPFAKNRTEEVEEEDTDLTPKPSSRFSPPPNSTFPPPHPDLQFSSHDDYDYDDDDEDGNNSIPQTPMTSTTTTSSTGGDEGYFDAQSLIASPSSDRYRHYNDDQNNTLSPRSIETTGTKRNNRRSIASSVGSGDSSSTFDYYPPNNGTIDTTTVSRNLDHQHPLSDLDSTFNGDGWSTTVGGDRGRGEGEGSLLSARLEGGIGGGSTSTIRLGQNYNNKSYQNRSTSSFDTFIVENDDRYQRGGGEGDERGSREEGKKVLKIRHSDSFETSRGGNGGSSDGGWNEDRYMRNSIEEGRSERGGGDETDDWDEEERTMGHGGGERSRGELDHGDGGVAGGGGDSAGVILGCHNIFLVLPQFLVTAISSIIFAILDPNRSVLAPEAPPPISDDPITNSSTTSALFPLATSSSTLEVRGSAVRWTRSITVDTASKILFERQQEDESYKEGYDALGLIFRIGGISAAISTVICFRMWRDRERDRRRTERARTGYSRAG